LEVVRKIDHSKHLLAKAVGASLLINLAMFLMAIPGSRTQLGQIFVKISDAIAVPPGLFVDVFAPKQHIASAFALAMLESLLFSLLFYAAASWLILKCAVMISERFKKEE